MTGESLSWMRKAMDMTTRFGCARMGCIPVGVIWTCASSIPSIFGMVGPWISISRRPTFWFFLANVTARFAEMVLFPTPPFPLRINMMFFIFLIFAVSFWSWLLFCIIFVNSYCM